MYLAAWAKMTFTIHTSSVPCTSKTDIHQWCGDNLILCRTLSRQCGCNSERWEYFLPLNYFYSKFLGRGTGMGWRQERGWNDEQGEEGGDAKGRWRYAIGRFFLSASEYVLVVLTFDRLMLTGCIYHQWFWFMMIILLWRWWGWWFIILIIVITK